MYVCTYIVISIEIVLVTGCSAWREVGETISSTDRLKDSGGAVAVSITGSQEDILGTVDNTACGQTCISTETIANNRQPTNYLTKTNI